ncbi:MobF family relaxase [Kitasatospora sp. NPDC059795]|uniref:MobF family relaxase n=1 Tax=Kitasatospora sp. NPDC059795 TaxID=3346949 RepID=UPI00365FB5AC
MGWVTPIRAPEQVDYRLSRDCGCDVEHDAQVEYRLASERDLRWIGSGLGELGLTAGGPVDPDAARALMDGRDWRTGEQLVKRKQVLDPRGKVPARVVVDAVAALAAADGITAAEYLGDDRLADRLARAERGLRREGERHVLPLADAERIAAAAGLDVEALYGADVVAEARPFAGRHVDVGLRGVDLVLDLPKSISTAWALAGDELAASIEDDWLASVGDAVAALEEWTAYGMAGHHGSGQRAERVDTSGFLGWTTLHRSARPVDGAVGDPHLHVHVNLAHMAKCADGKWRTIAAGAEDLLRHAHLINEIAEARLRQRLIERHGARFERSATTGAWELVGVPEQLRDAFSRRHQQVVTAAGQGATRDQQKAAARRTAEAKHDGQDAERTSWRARAVATVAGDLTGLTDDDRQAVLDDAGRAVDAMVRATLPGPDGSEPTSHDHPRGPVLPSPERIASQIWDDPEHGLVATAKVVGHTHVMSAVVQALPYLESVDQLTELVDQVLAVDGHAVRLTDSNRHHQVHRGRYTHTSVVAAEATIISTAATGYGRGLAQLTAEAAELTIATTEVAKSGAEQFRFSEQQRAVILRLLTAGHGAEAVIGVAGAGKTTLMQAARSGWEAAGLSVVGASTAAVAAANLAAEAGIDSRTIAAWTRDITGGRGLDGVGVLVIDEAAMVDDRALAALLRHASTTGTKVVAVGDPQQLRAVGVGGGFQRVHQIVDGLVLDENRRQVDPVERAVLETWRAGGRTGALAMLAEHGHVHAVDTVDEAHASMLASWDTARSRWAGDPHGQVADLLLLAARRADVAELNAGARALRVEAGELDGGRAFRAPDGSRIEFAAGDLVHVRRNDYRSRRGDEPDVLNGFRGVALEVNGRRGVLVEWRRPDGTGGHRTESAWMSPRDVAEGRLTHGYAMTIGSAQGLTSDVTIASGRGADAHSLYPALSRARQETHLFLPVAELEDDVTRITLGDPRTTAERLNRAVAAYGRQLQHDADDVMVVDEIAAQRGVPDTVPDAVPVADRPVPVADEHQAVPGDVPAQRQEPSAAELPAGFRTGRVLPVEPPSPPVPRWRERPHGDVATASLLPRAEQADQEADLARDRARQFDARADRLGAQLGTDQAPGRRTVAEIGARLDTAEQLLGRADAAELAADAIDARTAQMYAANREDMQAERRIRDRAALKRSAVLFQRGGMLEAADALRQRIDDRTARIEPLRQQAAELRGQGSELRQQASAELGAAGATGRGDAQHRISERRAALPALIERLDRLDLKEYQRLVTEAGNQRRTADQLDTRAAGLRDEATVRGQLPSGRRVTEETERAAAAVRAQQRRAAEQARAEAQRQRYEYRYEPPTQGRSGPSLGR